MKTKVAWLLCILTAGSGASCTSTPPGRDLKPPTKIGFQFAVGDRFRYRAEVACHFNSRAAGADLDMDLIKGRLFSWLEIELVKNTDEGFEGQVRPIAYELALGSRTWSFEHGMLTGSNPEEKFDPPIVSFKVLIRPDGALSIPEGGADMLSLALFDLPPSFPFSLTGWLGPLSEVELKKDVTWTSNRRVIMAREDFLPVRVRANRATTVPEGHRIPLAVGVNRDDNDHPYEWFASCDEEGGGSLLLDAEGRPAEIKINWSAQTRDKKPIASYHSWIRFER